MLETMVPKVVLGAVPEAAPVELLETTVPKVVREASLARTTAMKD